MNRRLGAMLLQAAVSVSLLVLLAQHAPVADIRQAVTRVRPTTLAACVTLSLLAYVGRSRRWMLLLHRLDVPLGSIESYRLTLLGTFYGLVTPGRVGEFARALHVRAPRSATLPSVVWDRVIDVLILEFLCLPGFVFMPQWRGTLLTVYGALVLATAVLLWVMTSPAAMRAALRWLPTITRPLQQWNQHSPGLLRSGMSRSSVLWGVYFYAVSFPAAWLLMRDVAPGASPTLLLGLPLLPLLGNLPIAFGGLGLRESVSAAVFSTSGAGAANGAAFSLLWFLSITLLPGMVGLAWSGLRRPFQGEPAGPRA